MTAPQISVVITTYNRAELLKGCLESLEKQTLDRELFETIVVDNNSTDATASVVRSFQSRIRLQYLLEARQGMNHARNMGMHCSKGCHVAYIDDDALAAPDWREVALRTFNTLQPTPDCVGGPIYPFYTAPRTAWFKDSYESRRAAKPAGLLTVGQSFSGSNMIWQKRVLEAVGGFDPGIGVTGNVLRLGGETDVFVRIWAGGGQPRLYFCPQLVVRHWVPEWKMTVAYQLRRRLAIGQASTRVAQLRSGPKRMSYAGARVLPLAKACLRALLRVTRHRRWQNWVVEDWGQVLMLLGELLGAFGVFLRLSQRG